MNTDLTALDLESENVQKPVEKGKSKPLLAAYATAAEGQPLEHYKALLNDHQEALQEDMDRQAERQAKRDAEKAKKANRQSVDATKKTKTDLEIGEPSKKSEAGEAKTKKRKKTAEEAEEDLQVCLFTKVRGMTDDSHPRRSSPAPN